MRYSVIVFDLDGTLIDSNRIKRAGYFHVFADRSECLGSLPGLLERMPGATRHEIIEAVAAGMEGGSDTQRKAEARQRTQRYTEWVEEQIIRLAESTPARWLLPQWSKRFPLYLCSLTPSEHLRALVTRLEWQRYFGDVVGAPVQKDKMLEATLARHCLRPQELLMVGDGSNDEAAARSVGAGFFQIRQMTDLLKLDDFLAS